MVDTALEPAPVRVANASIFLATLVAIVVLIGVLLSFDLFLARIDRQESSAHAASEYAAGGALLHSGHASDAVDHFSAAVAIDRSNVNYALALAEGMLQQGRTTEAEATLRTLLDRAGNDGAVNLTMAHAMIREGRMGEAKAYFHRAVFGRWGADSVSDRNQARFELIDFLAQHGTQRELLAELLPFEDAPADSVALRRRLGNLFISAGSPARAADMFREVLRRVPNDADAYAGMGEAAFALGNFRTARADFAEAARARPGDTHIEARMALADTVLALDPTARGVASNDRLTRSRALLARTLSAVTACGGPATAAADSARVLVAPSLAPAASLRAPRDNSDAAAEAMMSLTIELWSARPAACAATARDALRLVVSRIAQ